MSGAIQERHRLLERQLRKARGGNGEIDLDRLLELVSGAYSEQDESRRLNDHAVRLMSEELYALNAKIRAEATAEAKATEGRLFALLESIGDGVVVLDADANVIAFNAVAEAMFGRRQDTVIGQPFATLGLTHDPDAGRFLLEGLPESSAEIEGRRSDGEPFTAEVTAAFMAIDRQLRAVTLWRDITARKAAEDALRRARDEAHEANHAKSAFLATMSHEIRTPLNGVLGTAGALAQTELTASQREMVGVMLDSGDLLTTILSDILDLAKIEAGRLELERAAFRPDDVLKRGVNLFQSSAAAKGLEMRTIFGEGLDVRAMGDAVRLRQVVQNLLSNAIKFTATGGVDLVARLEGEAADGGRRLMVEVLDTGCGVPEKVAVQLFTRFTQADSSTTRQFGGTGLGLALCRELVGAMGGDIGLRPRPGGGSCFWFTIPLEAAGRGRTSARPDWAVATAGASTEAMRILAVDDNATNRFVLKTILEAAGHAVQLAENGAQAVQAASEADFDVILMDVHMPVLDGLAATHAIRALGGRRARTPIVAVTAEALPDQIQRAMAAGMDSHVTKPINPARLLAVVAAVLDVADSERRKSG